MTTTTLAKPEATINASFVVSDSSGPSLPWLQADDYAPKNDQTKIHLVIPEDSFNLLTDDAAQALNPEARVISTSEGNTPAFEPSGTRWIILARPQAFKVDSENRYHYLQKGVRFNPGDKSVTRLLLAAVTDTGILLDESGKIQIFTLKLKGMKTEFAKRIDNSSKVRSIQDMNAALEKHYKVRGWLSHLVSVAIEVVPRKFTTRDGSQASWGCMFQFPEGENARPLSNELQAQVNEFVREDEFMALAQDPFGINGRDDQKQAAEEEAPAFDPASIPF